MPFDMMKSAGFCALFPAFSAGIGVKIELRAAAAFWHCWQRQPRPLRKK
ncbi:hypothetical protein ACFQAT_24360 [Undibacterium arcticum]